MRRITDNVEISAIGGVAADLGECPVWHPGSQHLWMMDCKNGLIFDVNPETETVDSYSVPAPAGSFAFNSDGRLLVALKDRLVLFNYASNSFQFLAELPQTHPNLRFNDGTSLPDGGFVVGTMHVHRDQSEQPLGGIFHLDRYGTFSQVGPPLGVANGPNLSPFDNRFYICDSASRTIYSFVFQSGSPLSEQKTFLNTDALDSAPDGCSFDSAGGLWCALVHVGAVVRFDSVGKVSHLIDLPVSHPTSLCFGGANLNELFVTSIKNSGRLKASGPLDGGVLRIKNTGFSGVPQSECDITPRSSL